MASPSELSLDCKPHNNNYSMLLKSFGEQTDHTQKLEDFLSRLEEERLKIDAFKRELPLCMQLLSNAVETSRQQLQAYRANSNQGGRPVLEEFIPLKQYSESEVLATEKAASATATNMIISSDKANWMTTAQLWCQTTSNTTNDHHHQHGNNNKQQFNLTTIKSSPPSSQDHDIQTDIGFNITVSPNKQRINNGGAFLPFSKDRGGNTTTMLRSTSSSGLPDLALAAVSIEKDNEMEDNNNNLKKCFEGDHMGADQLGKAQNNYQTDGGHATTTTTTNTTSSNTNSSNQNHRKARRCWSPDLHRRFVNALQMLGGSQVATPKQIRELMKVDGLTNDEVKSHLQKYRLHTRRPSPSPQGTGGGGGGGQHHPQVVVLGGIWVPPEYAAAAAAAAAAAHGGGPTTTTTTTTLYGAPHPHYGASPLPPQQDHHFYTTAPPPLPHRPHHHHSQLLHHQHHHQQQQQLHVYKSSSQTNESSPESDVRGNGDPSESIEDGKSESSSWKGDSGENGGERKGLAALREEGEESNGSEITLKF